MNTSRTEHEAYEYTREDDLIGVAFIVEVEEDPEWAEDEWASGALALLILVFVGVVLWKVWVG